MDNTNKNAAENAAAEMSEEEKKTGRRTKVVIKDMTTDEQREKIPLQRFWHLEARSVIDGTMYTGDFTIKKMGIGAMGRKGVIRAQLNQGQKVDPQTDYLHEMMAQCIVSVIEHKNSDWFDDLSELADLDILTALFEEVRSFEASFRKVVG